jgi:hypothetical protein
MLAMARAVLRMPPIKRLSIENDIHYESTVDVRYCAAGEWNRGIFLRTNRCGKSGEMEDPARIDGGVGGMRGKFQRNKVLRREVGCDHSTIKECQ